MPVTVTPWPAALSFLLAFCHPCHVFSCCFSGIPFHETSAGKPFLGLLIWDLGFSSGLLFQGKRILQQLFEISKISTRWWYLSLKQCPKAFIFAFMWRVLMLLSWFCCWKRSFCARFLSVYIVTQLFWFLLRQDGCSCVCYLKTQACNINSPNLLSSVSESVQVMPSMWLDTYRAFWPFSDRWWVAAHWQDHKLFMKCFSAATDSMCAKASHTIVGGDHTLTSDQTPGFSLIKHLTCQESPIPFLCICVSAQGSCVPLIWKISKEEPGRISSKLSRLWLLKAYLVPHATNKGANKSILVLKSL